MVLIFGKTKRAIFFYYQGQRQVYLVQYYSQAMLAPKTQPKAFQSTLPLQIKQKTQTFRVQIRNRQIRSIRARIRDQLVRTCHIEKMLSDWPRDNTQAMVWAEHFGSLLGGTRQFKLTPYQAVDLFRLVQRFPNLLTLQLLQIVILKSDLTSIDHIFQFDIMKLLHTTINTYCKMPFENSRVKRDEFTSSFSSEDSQKIIKEAVQGGNHCKGQDQEVDIVRTVVAIVGALCVKGERIRNFAVINHKTFTYCLKAYKCLGHTLQSQFYSLLSSFTFYHLTRNQQQFSRITNRILSCLFTQPWPSNLTQPSTFNCIQHTKNMTYLLQAMANLLDNPCSWIRVKLQLVQQKYGKTLYQLTYGIVILFAKTVKECKDHGEGVQTEMIAMVKATLEVAMRYEEFMDTSGKGLPEEGHIHANKEERSRIYWQFSNILKDTKQMPGIQSIRTNIYFMLSNHFTDPQISITLKQSLLRPTNPQNLLSLILQLIHYQSTPKNLYQAFYLLCSMLQGLPIQTFQLLIFPSDLISTICYKIVELNSAQFASARMIAVKIMIGLMEKLESYHRGCMMKSCQNAIKGGFGQLFQKIVMQEGVDQDLCGGVQRLMRMVGGVEE